MLGFIQKLGPFEIVLILVIVLILFGPGKLPEVGKAVGRAIRSFKDAQKGVEDDVKDVLNDKEEEEAKPGEEKMSESNDKPTE